MMRRTAPRFASNAAMRRLVFMLALCGTTLSSAIFDSAHSQRSSPGGIPYVQALELYQKISDELYSFSRKKCLTPEEREQIASDVRSAIAELQGVYTSGFDVNLDLGQAKSFWTKQLTDTLDWLLAGPPCPPPAGSTPVTTGPPPTGGPPPPPPPPPGTPVVDGPKTPPPPPPDGCRTPADDAEIEKLEDRLADLHHEEDVLDERKRNLEDVIDQIKKQLTSDNVEGARFLADKENELQRTQFDIDRNENERENVENQIERLKAKKPCPPPDKKTSTGPGTGETGYVPGVPSHEGVVYVSTDSGKWCTYGSGNSTPVMFIPADEAGNPIAAFTPALPTALGNRLPNDSGRSSPVRSADRPVDMNPKLDSSPAERQPVTPDKEPQPKQPETPTPTALPDQPQTTERIPDNIFVKASETALEGGQSGQPIEGQVVKLFSKEKPALPGTRTADDSGFDKGPVECTTGRDGACKMQVPAEDRAVYGLAGGAPKNYRLDFNTPQQSGGVIETTGMKTKPDLSRLPRGVEATVGEFAIGNRTFMRLSFRSAAGAAAATQQLSRAFGDKYWEDDCRTKKPGPPDGSQPSSFSALNNDLPALTVELGNSGKGGAR
jgi:hypothetical protein